MKTGLSCFAWAALLPLMLCAFAPVEAAGSLPFERCPPKEAPTGQRPILLTLRATSALSEDAIQWIAHFSTPTLVEVRAGSSPEQVISSLCGHFSGAYWNELWERGFEQNADLQLKPVTKSRQMALPGCVFWKNDVDVDVFTDDTLDRVLEREVGLLSSHVLANCEQQGARKDRCDLSMRALVQRRNPGRDLDKLGALNKPLKLPLITRPSTISIRPECFPDAETALEAFEKVYRGEASKSKGPTFAADPEPAAAIGEKPPPDGDSAIAVFPRPDAAPSDFPRLDQIRPKNVAPQRASLAPAPPRPEAQGPVRESGVSDTMFLTAPLKKAAIKMPACLDALQTAANKQKEWPFDVNAIAKQFRRSLDILAQGDEKPESPIIGIVDTGLGLNDLIVPLDKFGLQTCTQPRSDCYLGGAVDDTSEFQLHCEYENLWHGSQVADLVLGGSEFRKAMGSTVIIKIAPYKVVRTYGTSQPVIATRAEISGLIKSAVDHQERPKPTILNISLGSKKPFDLESVNLNVTVKPLLVVAAGNHKEQHQDIPYPARYGGASKLRDQVMTVAAHDAEGKIADDFSARDGNIVDIAAPGCQLFWPMTKEQRKAICSNANDELSPELFGTSFAAPIVTFTAGLLQALGIKKSHDIKSRIIIAAHHDLDEDQVRLGSRLDIERAITVFEDQLVLKGGERLVGELMFPSPGGLCRGQLVREKHFNVTTKADKAGELIVLEKDGESNTVEQRKCVADSLEIGFRTRLGDERRMKWEDIHEIITRYRAPPPIRLRTHNQ